MLPSEVINLWPGAYRPLSTARLYCRVGCTLQKLPTATGLECTQCATGLYQLRSQLRAIRCTAASPALPCVACVSCASQPANRTPFSIFHRTLASKWLRNRLTQRRVQFVSAYARNPHKCPITCISPPELLHRSFSTGASPLEHCRRLPALCRSCSSHRLLSVSYTPFVQWIPLDSNRLSLSIVSISHNSRLTFFSSKWTDSSSSWPSRAVTTRPFGSPFRSVPPATVSFRRPAHHNLCSLKRLLT